jgi:hypothetical protein
MMNHHCEFDYAEGTGGLQERKHKTCVPEINALFDYTSLGHVAHVMST